MQISTKDTRRQNNRTSWDVRTERDAKHARLINLSNGYKVTLSWGLNEAMTRDGVVEMAIGDKKAMISAEELRRFLRWG